ncbi:MFS-type transporter SLC18B1-like [Ptychodera flava]|uniref:MFS-type transporter SLC18B1-like n=1 Tax=Ptychodera flava TaxID=63121 RepID=UPI00396A37B7
MATGHRQCEGNGPGNKHDGVKSENADKVGMFTRSQKITVVTLSLANLANSVSFSILAPFFPTKAKTMGASDTVIGLIFGCYSLVRFVVSPILGKFLPQIGARFMFLSGSFACGYCAIIYGFLDRLDHGTEFIAFCFVVRSIEAVGGAASTTASFAIVAKTFPDNLSTVFGILEIFSGLGFVIGPPIGGYLYEAGGFALPFVILGAFTLVVFACNVFILPHPADSSKPESGSMLQLLSMPAVWVTCGSVVATSMGISFIDPTLAIHLKEEFDFDPGAVGLMYVSIAAAYSLSAFFWGYMTDKMNIPKLLMIFGNIGACTAYLYVGPSPFMNLQSKLWLEIFSLVLLGLSLAGALVPSFHDINTTARWYGMPDNLGTYGVVSGVLSGFFSLGNFIGPTAGGALSDALSFSWAATIFAAFFLSMVLILILFCLWEYQCGTGRRVPGNRHENLIAVNYEDEERSPLLEERITSVE